MPGFLLEIELATPAGDELVDELMDDLADLHVALGSPRGAQGHMVVTMTVDASDLHTAVENGLARVAGRGPLIGYSVTPEELRDQRLGFTSTFVDRALSVPEAASLAEVTRQTMFRWVHSGRVAARQISDKSWAVDRASVEQVVRERSARQQEPGTRRGSQESAPPRGTDSATPTTTASSAREMPSSF